MFRLDSLLQMDSQQPVQVLVRDRGQQRHRPAQSPGGKRDRSDGMAHVMVAVAEGSFAVLPRLPPIDRRESDEQAGARDGFRQT